MHVCSDLHCPKLAPKHAWMLLFSFHLLETFDAMLAAEADAAGDAEAAAAAAREAEERKQTELAYAQVTFPRHLHLSLCNSKLKHSVPAIIPARTHGGSWTRNLSMARALVPLGVNNVLANLDQLRLSGLPVV